MTMSPFWEESLTCTVLADGPTTGAECWCGASSSSCRRHHPHCCRKSSPLKVPLGETRSPACFGPDGNRQERHLYTVHLYLLRREFFAAKYNYCLEF